MSPKIRCPLVGPPCRSPRSSTLHTLGPQGTSADQRHLCRSTKRPVPADRGDWFGAGAWVGPKTISMMGFMTNGLPLVMDAFDGEQALWPPPKP